MDENRITYFAETDARNKRVKFGIKAKDRTKHVYCIGKTGMGKSTMLENMAVQDIQSGEGMCFIDPHGKTADLLLEYVPKERINDVIYIAPFDVEHPISFNVLESVDVDKRHLVVSGLMSTFKKIWVDAWSARMEYILTNTLLALLECPGSTLLGVNKMLSDKEYRKEVVSKIQDPSVKAFWVKEFAGYTERMAAEAVPAIQNKVGQFTANPLIRNMIGQTQSSFDFREAMDSKKIVIINLSKGRIGDENMKLLGGMLVTKIYLAAMSRADLADRVMKVMPNFYLYVDEFQNFANASFADILSEARKYKLNLTIAHQYIEQMDEVVSAAVFGNVGTMITFRVGATDAEMLEKEFTPEFVIEDLVNLGFTQIYLKLMIDGLTSPPFSATTLAPITHPDISYFKEIIEASRRQFSRPRAQVEAEVIAFHDSAPKKVVKPDVVTSSTSTIEAVTIKQVQTPMARPANTLTSSNPIHATFSNPVQTSGRNSARSSNASRNISSDSSNNQGAQNATRAQSPSIAPTSTSTENVSKAPVSSNSPTFSRVSTSSNATTAPSVQKAVPLSTLHQAQRRSDPKVQTPQNVNSLRDALAAVLKKEPVKNPQPSDGAKPTNTSSPRVPVGSTGPTINPNTAFNSGAQKTSQPSQSSQPPQEVPEDVLKKVLKVD